jgi:hypothetical protein
VSILGLSDRICTLFWMLVRTVIELNLFRSIPPSQDAKILRRNRSTTRVYLISLLSTLFAVLIYTSFKEDTITVTVNSPSASSYTRLYIQYPTTLKCPCTQIANKYSNFILQIEPQYHQICSSSFISTEWIESLQGEGDFARLFDYSDDFRGVIRLQFLVLSKFCALSKQILNSSLSVFGQTNFITRHAIPPTEFAFQTEALIEQFKKTIIDQFVQTLKLIQTTNHGNQLATIFSSNWKFILKYPTGSTHSANSLTDPIALARPKTYGLENCSCAIEPNCSKPTDFAFRALNQSLRQILPGFRAGCSPLNALLQSSLICLYNQSCLDMMRALIYYSTLPPVQILTFSAYTESNATIERILDQLFVSRWFRNFSYERYFSECAPLSCQYSYSIKFNRLYIITTFIALFGGLSKGLYILISCAAWLLFKLFDYLEKKKQVDIITSHSQQPNMLMIDEQHNTLEPVPRPVMVISQAIQLLCHTFYAFGCIFSSL